MEHITWKEIFTSLGYHSAEFTIIKTLIWLIIALVMIYLLYFLYSKILFRKKRGKELLVSDTRLSLSLLWAVVSFLVVFSILFTVLLYYIDFGVIDWSNYQVYLAFFKHQTYSLFPYIICYVAVILFYYFKRSKFKKNLNTL